MKSNILGVHANFFTLNGKSNETSAAVLKSGKLASAIAEERLSRVKLDNRFPEDAIKEALRLAGTSSKEISCIAVPAIHPYQSNLRYLKSAWSTYQDTGVLLGKKLREFAFFTINDLLRAPRSFSYTVDGVDLPIELHDHHKCHAASAYYTSPFENALVITLDGGGDGIDGSVYYGSETKLERIMEIPHFQSPGTMYSSITNDLGFTRHRHEGKITGLAAYGNPDLKRLGLDNLLRYDTKKGRFISSGVAAQHKDINANSSFFYPLLDRFPKEDLAAAAQFILEREVIAFVSDAIARARKAGHPIGKICLAGGVFANVKLNQRILEIPDVDNVFVFPSMGDDGLSCGAALCSYYEQEEVTEKDDAILKDVYLGTEYSDDDIEQALKEANVAFERHQNVEVEIAKLLNEGKVIGRFNGKMEYGPRALGNRSIIASPFDKEINNWLNKRLKRTEFMPFAPSINAEHATDFFEGYKDDHVTSDFMTMTYNVREEKQAKIPAVVHVDGTARPQIVRRETNASYHKIIEEFYKLSSIPLVLNTSFNVHEQPIVRSPEDAISGFKEGKLDVLAIGNYICVHQ